MQTLLLILKFLPMVLEIVKLIQQARMSAAATDEMLSDLQMTADYLVSRSGEARAKVESTDEAIDSDPNNRDNS
jgi:hypothetical protein